MSSFPDPALPGWTGDELVEAGDLRGRRVLVVGPGSGRLAAALAERATARVWALEPAPGQPAPPGVRVKAGVAEAMPFRDGWFERAVLESADHLSDRRCAFAEFRRVLAPGGRIAIGAAAAGLDDELREAGFDGERGRAWLVAIAR
jgi:ubiquinone/menaquinone biosynthesis C-methylase UbiE